MKKVFSVLFVVMALLAVSCANNANKPAEAEATEVVVEEVADSTACCADSTACCADSTCCAKDAACAGTAEACAKK